MNAPAKPILIIGIGNPLRSDDGLGWAVAQHYSLDPIPERHVHVVHQLTPEMALWMSEARLVVMIDASHEGEPGELCIRSVTRSPRLSAVGTHYTTPEELAALTAGTYGQCPPVVVITMTGAHFGIGEHLSPMIGRKISCLCAEVDQVCGLRVFQPTSLTQAIPCSPCGEETEGPN